MTWLSLFFLIYFFLLFSARVCLVCMLSVLRRQMHLVTFLVRQSAEEEELLSNRTLLLCRYLINVQVAGC